MIMKIIMKKILFVSKTLSCAYLKEISQTQHICLNLWLRIYSAMIKCLFIYTFEKVQHASTNFYYIAHLFLYTNGVSRHSVIGLRYY